MLQPNGAAWMLWAHVIAACVWIGGQITLAALVPLLRGDRAVLRAAARRFAIVSWAAFVVLILTGIANVHNAGISWTDHTSAATKTLETKLVLVAISGLAAAVHSLVAGPRAGRTGSSRWKAANGVLGAATLLAALGAALYGVVLVHH